MPTKTTLATVETVKPEWLHIDATDLVVGRLAVQIATILRGKHKPSTPRTSTPATSSSSSTPRRSSSPARSGSRRPTRPTPTTPAARRSSRPRRCGTSKPEEILYQAVKRMVPRNRLGRKQMNKLKIYAGPQHPHQAQQPEEFKLS